MRASRPSTPPQLSKSMRRIIDELIDTGVPAVAATGRGSGAWTAVLYVVIPLLAILLLVGVGDRSTQPSAPPAPTNPRGASAVTSTITAENISFDTKRIRLEAKATATIQFENNDTSAVSHNLAIYEDKDRSVPVFQGEIIHGGTSIDYEFEVPKPGRYFFQCDVHPVMNGTVEVR